LLRLKSPIKYFFSQNKNTGFSGFFFLRLSDASDIYDSNGNLILTQTITGTTGEAGIDISGYPPGIYRIKIITDTGLVYWITIVKI